MIPVCSVIPVPIRRPCAAAALMEKEIDFTKIITETFDEKTYAQNQVLGRALLESFLLWTEDVLYLMLQKKRWISTR